MSRWLFALWLALATTGPAGGNVFRAELSPGQRQEVQRWVATLPAEWRDLDWPSLIEEVATPLPETYGSVPILQFWLPDLFKWALIPGPGDPPVIVLSSSCQCSAGVLEVALVRLDGTLERIAMPNGLIDAEFKDGALHLKADKELDGDANCCPSVIEHRVLRWQDEAPVWSTEYHPGQLSLTLGCWHAARLVDAKNARWVDVSTPGMDRRTLQRRLFACSDDPEREKQRVSCMGPGLRIALREGTIGISWNPVAQRWEVKDAPRRRPTFNDLDQRYLRHFDDMPLVCDVTDDKIAFRIRLDPAIPRMAIALPEPAKTLFGTLLPGEGPAGLLLRLEDLIPTDEGRFLACTDDLGDRARLRFDGNSGRIDIVPVGKPRLSGQCVPAS